MKYLKVWTSFLDLLETLEYDEIGRLFVMMLLYARNGEESPLEDVDYPGNERFVWPAAKQQIDLTAERNEKLRENGLKGGRPKTKQNQIKPNETKLNQTKAVKESNVKESNVKEIKPSVSFLEDNAAHEIQKEQDFVLTAAENAGFNKSPMSRAKIVELYAMHGKDKMLNAINECVMYGVTNLAYLEAVLRGGPKKAKPRVEAQNFEQRDYSDVNDQMLNDLAAEVAAFKEAES